MSTVNVFGLRRIGVTLLALLLAGAALGCDGCGKDEAKEPAEGDEAKLAEAGEKVFKTNCVSCHSIGDGDMTGPDLAGVTERRERKWLEKWIQDPVELVKTDKKAQELKKEFNDVQMPDMGLTDEQVDQVLAYIEKQSAEGGMEKLAVADLKPAEEIQGRPVAEFISSECGGCHNPKRTGATGPNITKARLHDGAEELKPLSLQALIATIKEGREGTSMPAWNTAENPTMEPLKEGEIHAVAKYLWTEEAPERFEFTVEDMEETHEVLIPDDKLPSEPTHGRRVEDLLLVTEREAFRVAVIDGDELDLVGHMKAGARAHGYTFSPDGRFAYNLGRDGWLYKYDLYSLKPTHRIRTGLDARGIAIDDGGKYILAGMYIPTQAVMLDAKTLEPLKVFDTHQLEDPNGKTVDSRICSVNDVKPDVGPYFLMALKEAGQVWRIDYSDESFPVTAVKKVGEILHDGFLRHDNKVFYLASQTSNHMAAIDVESMEVIAKIPTGEKPHPGPGAIWHEDGKEYAATPHIGEGKTVVWDTHTNEMVGEVPGGGPGLFIRADPKMKYVWFDTLFQPGMEEITVFERKPPFEVVKVIKDGTQTMHPEPDVDGDYVFVSDWQENVVRVYDDETLELVKTIEGLETPTGVFSVQRANEVEGH